MTTNLLCSESSPRAVHQKPEEMAAMKEVTVTPEVHLPPPLHRQLQRSDLIFT